MAGGRLNGALLRAELVDEVNILFTPRLIGEFDTPALFDSPDLGEDEWPTPLVLVSVEVTSTLTTCGSSWNQGDRHFNDAGLASHARQVPVTGVLPHARIVCYNTRRDE
jgi:hypothetical protein